MAMATARASTNAVGGRGVPPPSALSLWTSREGAAAPSPSPLSLVSSSSGSAHASPPTPQWPAVTVQSKPPPPPSPSAITVLPVADGSPSIAAVALPAGRGREASTADARRSSAARRSTRRSSSARRAAAAPPTVTLISGGAVGAAAPAARAPSRRHQSDMAGGGGDGCGGARGPRRSSAEQRLSAAASDVSVDKADAGGADPLSPVVAPARKPTPALVIPASAVDGRPVGGAAPMADWPADVVDRPSSVTSLDSLTASTSTDGAGAKVALPKAKVFMLKTPALDDNDAVAAAPIDSSPTRLPFDESLGLDDDEEIDEDDNVFTEVASMATVSCAPAPGFDRALDGPAPALPKPDAREASSTKPPPPPVRKYAPPAPAVTNRAPRPPPPRSLKPPVPVPAGVGSARPRTPRHYPRSQSRTQSTAAPGAQPAPAEASGLPQRVCSSSVAALWHGPVSLVDQPPSIGMAALRMESAPALAQGGPVGGAPHRRPSGRDWDDEDDVAAGGAPPPAPYRGGGGTKVAVSTPPGRVGATTAAAPTDAKTRYHRLRWWKNKAPAGNRQSDAATRRAAAVLHGESRRPAGQGRGSIVDAACQVSMMADDFIEFATGGKLGAGGAAGSPNGGGRADGGRAHRLLVRPLRWLQRSVQPVQVTQRIKGG